MSDQWGDAREELVQAREALIEQQDEHGEVLVIPYTPTDSSGKWEAMRAALEGIIGGPRSEWIELWCEGHPTGAALRMVAGDDGWDLEPMRRRSVPTLTAVSLPADPSVMGVPISVPQRLELVCGQCGRQLWRRPQALIDAVLPALATWHRRRAAGHHARPRVSLTGATA